MTRHNDWNVQDEIFPMFEFILPMFESIFGHDTMNKVPFTIKNVRNCDAAPIIDFRHSQIILDTDPSLYERVAFQMAHELTHYAVKKNADPKLLFCTIAPFEEAAAEAMALYVLKLCTEQWENCKLCREYAMEFETLRKYKYNEASGASPKDYGEWEKLCNDYDYLYTHPVPRPNISVMRNTLYDAFVQFPHDIGILIKYPLFIRNAPYEKLIDEDAWKAADPANASFISAICAIQPKVK